MNCYALLELNLNVISNDVKSFIAKMIGNMFSVRKWLQNYV